MLHVLFFAQTRELIGIDRLELEAAKFHNAEQIRAQLATRGDKWALALEKDKLLVAINQRLVPMTTEVKAGDEIAFFPPVTGG